MKKQNLKWILVVGARPNFMKIAPIVRAVERSNASLPLDNPGEIGHVPEETCRKIQYVLVHTGQHYDFNMSDSFFKDLKLPKPDIHLEVGSGTHGEQTGSVLIKFEKVLMLEKPDLLIVVGDVNSTLACALAAAKLQIPIAHVESGLRSFDRTMPEEINRLLTDAVSDYLFTPSPDADENLKKEGVPDDKIFMVGDVMVDSLMFNIKQAGETKIIERLNLKSEKDAVYPYAVLTLHRPSNVDDQESLLKILTALREISVHIPVVFPAHPRTVKRIEAFNYRSYFIDSYDKLPSINNKRGIYLISPLGYLEFLSLMANSTFVLTDSGGIQEETTVLGIPCLTLRNTTERPITISHGTNVLVWNDTRRIIEETQKILGGSVKKGCCPDYWDGRSSERIVDILLKKL